MTGDRVSVSTRTLVRWCVALLIVLALAAIAWLGIRGALAKQEVDALTPLVTQARQAVDDGDVDAIGRSADAIHERAAAASTLLGDPLWDAAEALPMIGGDISAVRTSLELTANISGNLTPVITALHTSGHGLSAMVTLLHTASAPLDALATSLTTARTELTYLPKTRFPSVTDAVSELGDIVAQAEPTVTQLAHASALLPNLLGAEGERHILLMSQNLAEARTGGGITGSFLLLDAIDGTITLVDQADSSTFDGVRPIDPPPLPEGLSELYGHAPADHVQNVTMTSDFSLSARLAVSWWRAVSDVTPDVVISIDPVVLQSLLRLTGPVDVPGLGTLTADNVLWGLLRAPYDYGPDMQTSIQRKVTAASMIGILSADLDPRELWATLSTDAAAGRISVWSADDDEERLLASSLLGGPSARQRAIAADAFVVGLDDTTGGKMGSFLHAGVEYGSAACRADGHTDVVVRVSLRNEATQDEVSQLSYWMTGGGLSGVTVGHIGTSVRVSAPEGWLYGGVSRDGVLVVSANAEDDGLPTSIAASDVAPGDTDTLEFRFISPAPDPVDAEATTAPLLNPAEMSTFTPTCG